MKAYTGLLVFEPMNQICELMTEVMMKLRFSVLSNVMKRNLYSVFSMRFLLIVKNALSCYKLKD